MQKFCTPQACALGAIISLIISGIAPQAEARNAHNAYVYSNEAVIVSAAGDDHFNVHHCFTKTKPEIQAKRVDPERFRLTLHGSSPSRILEDTEHYDCRARNNGPIRYDEVSKHVRQARLDIETFFGRDSLTRYVEALPSRLKRDGIPASETALAKQMSPGELEQYPPFRINGDEYTGVSFRAGLTEFELPVYHAAPPRIALDNYMKFRYSDYFDRIDNQGRLLDTDGDGEVTDEAGSGNYLRSTEPNAEEIFRGITAQDRVMHFNAFALQEAMTNGMPRKNADVEQLDDAEKRASNLYIGHGLVFLEVADVVNSQKFNNEECLEILAELERDVNEVSDIPSELIAFMDILSYDEWTAMSEEDFNAKFDNSPDAKEWEINTGNICTRRLLALEKLLIKLKNGRSNPSIAKVVDLYEGRIAPYTKLHVLPLAANNNIRAD